MKAWCVSDNNGEYGTVIVFWVPCSERLPEEDGYYLVTNSKWGSPWREIVLWMFDGWQSGNEPIAWMPLPEPFEPQESEVEK